LNEMGRWNPDAIERQLAHQEQDEVRNAYMHAAEFWAERVEMMQAWADYLDALKEKMLSRRCAELRDDTCNPQRNISLDNL